MSNVFDIEWDAELPAPFSSKVSRVGARAGSERLGATVYELAPGGAVSPYHVHHGNEEMLVVLAGRPTLRTPAGIRELETGEVVAFPRGPEGAHRVSNRSEEITRVLLISEMNFPEVAEHLDNGTVLAISGLGPAGPQGKLFPGDSELDLREAMMRGMAASADAERD
jgi:uncharacterized cupin superfamily protein